MSAATNVDGDQQSLHKYDQPAESIGNSLTPTQQVCDSGISTLQSLTPVNQVRAHLCALHAYSNDRDRQIISHHYCHHLSSEMHQCLIYDSTEKSARLIGIEYLISRRLFDTLPQEEKQYWHSHQYEVKSGMLVAPDIPEPVERNIMSQIANMYGKIIHTWQTDRYSLPIGPPQLMTSLTTDEEVNQQLFQQQEKITGISAKDRKAAREGKIEYAKLPIEIDSVNRAITISFEPQLRQTLKQTAASRKENQS